MGPPPPDDDERGTDVEIARRGSNARLYWDHRYFLHFGIRELPKKFKRHSYDGTQWVESALPELRGSEFEDAQDEKRTLELEARKEAFERAQQEWQEYYKALKEFERLYVRAPAHQNS